MQGWKPNGEFTKENLPIKVCQFFKNICGNSKEIVQKSIPPF